MGTVDYYGILKVGVDASDEDVKKAYKRLAMQWHPDKNPFAAKKESEAKFKQILEAYNVLGDPQKRKNYDAFVEERRKLSTQPYSTTPRAPSPSASGGSYSKKTSSSVMEHKLACSLEELHKGTYKEINVAKEVADSSGEIRTMEEITLGIAVKPGWKQGTKIAFPSGLVFVIDEEPHGLYRRDGNDLVFNQRLSLLDVVAGKTLKLPSLDGRTITVVVTLDIVRLGYEMIVPGDGMPIPKEPGKKGNLRIKFDLKIPSRLTSEHKAILRKIQQL